MFHIEFYLTLVVVAVVVVVMASAIVEDAVVVTDTKIERVVNGRVVVDADVDLKITFSFYDLNHKSVIFIKKLYTL